MSSFILIFYCSARLKKLTSGHLGDVQVLAVQGFCCGKLKIKFFFIIINRFFSSLFPHSLTSMLLAAVQS